MAGTLGTITGQVRIDVKQAVAAYAAVRAANISTLLALRSASTVFLAAGAAMGGAGLLIAAGFVKAIKVAADFERQLDFFGAVSNSTAKEMEAVRAKAIQLGKDTIFSTGQIADSFVELGKAGVSAKDIVNGVGQAVASLGAAGDIPLDQAANIITAALQTFKLGADQAVHVADLLAGAANSSVVDIDDLGVSLKYVGGVAASISIPIGDTIDAISLLGKAGIRGSTAGTSLRQILVSLTGTSKKAHGVLEDLGIITEKGGNAFFTAQGKAKPLSEIFQILQDKTKGLTEAQRLSAFKTIFNNRALAAANILSREGAKGFAEMNKEISKTTAADVAAKRLDNLSGDVEKLKSNIEVLALNAGAPFQNFLRGVVQNLTKLISAFTNLSPRTQDTIFKVVALGGAVLLLMGVLSTAIGIVLKFASNMLLMGKALRLIVGILKAVRVGFIATWLAALGPVGLVIVIILAVIAVLVLLWFKCEGFRNVVKAVGAAIVAAFWAVVNFFRGPFVQAMVTAWTAVVNAFTTAKDAVVNAWNAVGNFFKTIGTTILTAIVTAFNAVVTFFAALPGRILTFIVQLVTGVIHQFAMLPEAIAYTLGFILGLMVRIWIFIFQTVTGIINTGITAIINFFAALPGRIGAFFQAVWSLAVSIWNAISNAIKSAAKAAFNGVISFFSQLPGRVGSFFANTYTAAVNKLNALKASAISIVKSIVTSVGNFFSQLPGKIDQALTRAADLAKSKMTALKNNVVNIAKQIPGAIKDALGGLKDAIFGAFQAAIDTLGGLGGAAYDKAKSIGGSLWKGFKDGMGIHSPSFIEKAMFQVHDTLTDELRFMSRSVRRAQGLSGNIPAVQRSITSAQQARNAVISNSVASGSSSSTTDNDTVDPKHEELIAAFREALDGVELPVYLDGKKVDAVMSNAALAGGYGNERR